MLLLKGSDAVSLDTRFHIDSFGINDMNIKSDSKFKQMLRRSSRTRGVKSGLYLTAKNKPSDLVLSDLKSFDLVEL